MDQMYSVIESILFGQEVDRVSLPDDHKNRIVPSYIKWHGPFKKPDDSHVETTFTNKARQSAIENSANLRQGIYVLAGWNNRYLPQRERIGYIGSSKDLSDRIKSTKEDHGLQKMDSQGRITKIFFGEMRNKLTDKTVLTGGDKTIEDYKVAEHLLIAFFQNSNRSALRFQGDDKGARDARYRSALLVNRFENNRRFHNIPDILYYKLEQPEVLFCWWVKWSGAKSLNGKITGKCIQLSGNYSKRSAE